ncbi:MAG: hypothetical protein OEM63_14685, partial [Gammaproteobacteria bacterium]|nr:hypothetical protein [Gammaproteobacteria bacterium]
MTKTIFSAFILVFAAIAFADDGDDAGAKLYEYFEVFNAKDVEKVANYIYSTPVHIGGGASHQVLADPAAAIENLNSLYPP